MRLYGGYEQPWGMMMDATLLFLVVVISFVMGALAYRWLARNKPEITERIDEKLDD